MQKKNSLLLAIILASVSTPGFAEPPPAALIGNLNNPNFTGQYKQPLQADIYEEGNLLQGKRDGIVKIFNSSGEIIGQTNYKNGIPDGPSKSCSWYGSGKLSDCSEGTYVNGKLDGLVKTVSKDPTQFWVEKEETYKNGMPDGPAFIIHDDGMMERGIKHEENGRVGTWKTYYKSGKLYKEETYVNYVLSGVVKVYHENGTLSEEEMYENGKMVGAKKTYDEASNLTQETGLTDKSGYTVNREYKDGKLEEFVSKNGTYLGVRKYQANGQYAEGPFKTFYDDGKEQEEGTYVNGLLDGMHKRFYKSGNILAEETYTNGALNGTQKTYSEQGNLFMETPYKDGKREGIEKDYYPSGQVMREQPWQNGNMMSPIREYRKNGTLFSEKSTDFRGVTKYFDEQNNEITKTEKTYDTIPTSNEEAIDIAKKVLIENAKWRVEGQDFNIDDYQCNAQLQLSGAYQQWSHPHISTSKDFKDDTGIVAAMKKKVDDMKQEDKTGSGFWQVACDRKDRKKTAGIEDNLGVQFIRIDNKTGKVSGPMTVN